MLGVSERALYEWLRRRDPASGAPLIPHLRLGRRVLVSRAWLEAQIAALGTAEPGGGSPGPERKGGA